MKNKHHSKMQTPKAKTKLSTRSNVRLDDVDTLPSGSAASTPKQGKHIELEEEFIQCTQEIDDDMDVIWDWNSPRVKQQRYIRKNKKLDLSSQSPKLTIKKHPSNSQIQKFDKLKEEVAALRNQMINPNNEGKNLVPESSIKTNTDVFNDLFEDDSLDEQFVLCTQMVEKEMLEKQEPANKVIVPQISSVQKTSDFKIEDDSFDFAMSQIDDSLLEKVCKTAETQVETTPLKAPNISNSFPQPSRKDNNQSSFRKSMSFEDPLGKPTGSPIKYSPEEIEQKRLQAIAKLKEKRKQEIIERNRKEALKRLEQNKKRRTIQCNKFL